MSDTAILQELIDHREITDLVSRLCIVYDDHRVEDMPNLCTEDVTADYPGVPTIRGRDALIESGNRGRQAFERVRHLVTNLLIDLDGDRATLSANMFAVGVYRGGDPSSIGEVGGVWTMEAKRLPEGWRLSRIAFEQWWMAGDPSS